MDKQKKPMDPAKLMIGGIIVGIVGAILFVVIGSVFFGLKAGPSQSNSSDQIDPSLYRPSDY